MRTGNGVTGRFEFCFPRMDTLVLVEVTEGDVTIRATRDSFSPQRKARFVRELVSEGFIPEEYRWLPVGEPQSYQRGVRWVVDFSWLGIDEEMMARMRRKTAVFLGMALVFTVVLVGLAANGHLGNQLPEAAGVHRPYSH
jgi:hypothetical protein